ncbi:MAG: tetratricopeptide repeat protein [Lachnospira eligens]
MAKKSFSGSGSVDVVKANPTRLDFLNDTMYKTASKNLGGRFDNYKQYLSSLITKYPNSKIAKDAKKGLQNIDDK